MSEVKVDFMEKELEVSKYIEEKYGEDLINCGNLDEVGNELKKGAILSGIIATAGTLILGSLFKRASKKYTQEIFNLMNNDEELQRMFKEIDDARNELHS
jgi:hypothetical protein|nr:MAG TPA: hypothetical protein [Caudoviricetes sp.]